MGIIFPLDLQNERKAIINMLAYFTQLIEEMDDILP